VDKTLNSFWLKPSDNISASFSDLIIVFHQWLCPVLRVCKGTFEKWLSRPTAPLGWLTQDSLIRVAGAFWVQTASVRC
jgi:hypothetical protein